MRLYGGERISGIMDTMRVDENMPLESGMLSKTIEGAQKRKEGINFAARKNVLEYDDVMNKQRELIYNQRNRVLDGENLKDTVLKMIDDTIDIYTKVYLGDEDEHDNWDINGLREYFAGWVTDNDDLQFTTEKLQSTQAEEIAQQLKDKDIKSMIIAKPNLALMLCVRLSALYCCAVLTPTGWII